LATDEVARVIAPGRARAAALAALALTQVGAGVKEVLYLTSVLQSQEPLLTGEALLHLRGANVATLVQVLALGAGLALAHHGGWIETLAAAPRGLFHSRWLLNPRTTRGQVGWLLFLAWLGALAFMR
jgi:hypothetical protein